MKKMKSVFCRSPFFSLFLMLLTAFCPLPDLSAATTVTLNGKPYTLKDHPRVWLDGPTGPITASLKPPSAKISMSNPAYKATIGNWNFYQQDYGCGPGLGSICLNGQNSNVMVWTATGALLWMANGSDPNDATYLPAAKYGINHIEDILNGSIGCDESRDNCGGRYALQDYVRLWLPYIAEAYSIIHDTLTPAERQLFADKMLNGNAVGPRGSGHKGNGTGGSATSLQSDCIPLDFLAGPGTISVTGNQIVASNPIFDSTWIESALMGQNGSDIPSWRIISVQDATHATISMAYDQTHLGSLNNYTAVPFNYSKAWKQDTGGGIGNCGIVWWFRHHPGTVRINPGQESTFVDDYPTIGGSLYPASFHTANANLDLHNTLAFADDNQVQTQLIGETDIAMALADDDVRAQHLLTTDFNYWYNYELPSQLSHGAFSYAGAGYQVGRNDWVKGEMGAMMCNSLVETGPGTPCDWAASGRTLESMIPYYLYMMLPDMNMPERGFQYNTMDGWGSIIGGSAYQEAIRPSSIVSSLYPNNPDTAYLRTLMTQTNVLNVNISSWLPWIYTFYDPAQPSAPLSLAPKQYVFRADYDRCESNSDWTGSGKCNPNTERSYFVSLTGWNASDTHIHVVGGFQWPQLDHDNQVASGHYQIYKNGVFLLNWDDTYTGTYYLGDKSNNIELGGDNWAYSYSSTKNGPAYANVTRWAGQDPHGDPHNNYTYGLVDLTPAGTTGSYTPAANAVRVNRHFFHFKKPGTQDVVMSYDDVLTSQPNLKKAYWHFELSNLGQYGDAIINTAARTVSLTHGTLAELGSAFLPADGNPKSIALKVDSANGAYPGGGGWTARAYVCPSTDGTTCNASATAGEWWAIHMPAATTNVPLPTVAALTLDPAWTGVEEVNGKDPKVAVMARGGQLKSSVGFATSICGTAQYVVAGLTAGTYNIYKDGALLQSGVAVASNDNTLYFEAPSGGFQVYQQGGAPPAVPASPAPICAGGGSSTLPDPILNLPASLPINVTIQLANAANYTGANFNWTFTPQSPAGPSGHVSALGSAASISKTSQAPQLSLGPLNLSLGTYVITVQAEGDGQTSNTATATVAFTLADLSAVKVYPNPWRLDKHAGKKITFDGLTAASTIKIFTVSGHKVTDFVSAGSTALWDLSNDHGDKVASGVYLYLITDKQGDKVRGKFAIVR